MNEKIKEFFKYFFNEILSMGIGWTAGLIAIQMLNNYFEKGRNQLVKDGEWMRPTDSGLWFKKKHYCL